MTIPVGVRNVPEVIFLIGIPGSGKTAFYRERFFDSHVRLSFAMLRTRRREERLVQACLEAEQSFVLDRIHPLSAERRIHLRLARKHGFATTAYFFKTPLHVALQRNEARPAREQLSQNAIIEAHNQLEPPGPAEPYQRFFLVTWTSDGRFLCRERSSRDEKDLFGSA